MEDGAAILVIGNEILSGKVRDSNSPFIVNELRALGYPVREIRVVPDEVDAIAAAVCELSGAFAQVITSGGVGPTLDDVTFEGISQAFGMSLHLEQRLAEIIRNHFGEGTTESHMKMALVPTEASLEFSEGLPWPVVEVRNVMVLPGDPAILRKKFVAVKERFRRRPWRLSRVYTRLDEGDVAPLLDRLQQLNAGVSIGSYPVYENPEYEVQVTLEAKEDGVVEKALQDLSDMLKPENIVRIE